jgi:hypothetical protein
LPGRRALRKRQSKANLPALETTSGLPTLAQYHWMNFGTVDVSWSARHPERESGTELALSRAVRSTQDMYDSDVDRRSLLEEGGLALMATAHSPSPLCGMAPRQMTS